MADEKFYLIKMIAKDPATRSFALVCMAVPEIKSGVDRIDVIVSQNPETILIGQADSYRDCKNRIQKIILTGSVAQSSTQSLANSYRSSFSSESYMIEFLHYLENSEEEKLKALIAQNINKVFGRTEAETQLFVSKVTKSELDAVSSQSREKEEEVTPNVLPPPASIPTGSAIVNFQFILSPVTGTVVSDLRVGDQVMVKILPDSDPANRIIQELSLKDNSNSIHPCTAGIVEVIKHDPSRIETVVKIADGVYGRYLEDEISVRVKMAETSTAEIEENVIREAVINNERNWFIPAIISFGVLTILWVIVAFFIL